MDNGVNALEPIIFDSALVLGRVNTLEELWAAAFTCLAL